MRDTVYVPNLVEFYVYVMITLILYVQHFGHTD